VPGRRGSTHLTGRSRQVPRPQGTRLRSDRIRISYFFDYPGAIGKTTPDGAEIWSVGDSAVEGIYPWDGPGGSFEVAATTNSGSIANLYSVDGAEVETLPFGQIGEVTSTSGVHKFVLVRNCAAVYNERVSPDGEVLSRFANALATSSVTGTPFHPTVPGGAFKTNDVIYGISGCDELTATSEQGILLAKTTLPCLSPTLPGTWMYLIGSELYVTAGGTGKNDQNISEVRLSDLEDAVAVARARQLGGFGWGAGIVVGTSGEWTDGNYPSAGSLPEAYATFDPSWVTRAVHFSLAGWLFRPGKPCPGTFRKL